MMMLIMMLLIMLIKPITAGMGNGMERNEKKKEVFASRTRDIREHN